MPLLGNPRPGDGPARSPGYRQITLWAGATANKFTTGGEVDEDGDWHMVMVDGAQRIGVQLAPDHVPPEWPDGPAQQQMHLDLWVEDFAEAHEQVMALGASVLKAAAGTTSGDDFQVYADPAGHPFCLCWLVAEQRK
ncbi:VOC family protein [Amycolatopsis sp. NPDC058986]|uniref:VOC family protein n=1 Tax=unclassified Amycolatopsis TaxID=2618356 RepID=UPI00366A96D3